MYFCKFCNKDCHNNGGLKSHEPHCKNNPNYIKRSTGSYGQSPWNKGLTKDTSEILKNASEKLHIKYMNKELIHAWIGKKHSSSYKVHMSNILKERHKNGWDNKCGRAPKYKYHSDTAGDITVDGSWELAVAKYLDNKHYNWKRNKKRFKYINLMGNEAFYTPDFYLVNENTYIEVKGYETELDKCKWKQFPENLLIWKKQNLIDLGIL